MLNKNEQNVYNQYQRILGQQTGRPFKYRKNFETFERDNPEAYLATVKIARIFAKYPNINTDLYFRVPFILHASENRHIPIEEYSKQRAISQYGLCAASLKKCDTLDPGVDKVIVDSLVFIKDFCIDGRLTLPEYIELETELNHRWIIDYATSNISKWVIIGFDNMGYDTRKMIMDDCGPDERSMMNLTSYIEKFDEWKNVLKNTPEINHLVSKGLRQIEAFLKKHIDSLNEL